MSGPVGSAYPGNLMTSVFACFFLIFPQRRSKRHGGFKLEAADIFRFRNPHPLHKTQRVGHPRKGWAARELLLSFLSRILIFSKHPGHARIRPGPCNLRFAER